MQKWNARMSLLEWHSTGMECHSKKQAGPCLVSDYPSEPGAVARPNHGSTDHAEAWIMLKHRLRGSTDYAEAHITPQHRLCGSTDNLEAQITRKHRLRGSTHGSTDYAAAQIPLGSVACLAALGTAQGVTSETAALWWQGCKARPGSTRGTLEVLLTICSLARFDSGNA